MFEWFYYSSVVDAISKAPREIVIAAVAAYVVVDIHKRNSQVSIAEAESQKRVAELEVEALKLKLQLQNTTPHAVQ